MTTVQLPRVDQPAIPGAGLTPEVLTVSGLLSMPAVWTAVVERELPANVLLERFLIVLLACTLVAELVRRLGEGGALAAATTGDLPAGRQPSTPAGPRAPASPAAGALEPLVAEAPGAFEGSALALDAPLAGFDDGLTGFDDGLGDLGDLGDFDLGGLDPAADLAPLDLDADPFGPSA